MISERGVSMPTMPKIFDVIGVSIRTRGYSRWPKMSAWELDRFGAESIKDSETRSLAPGMISGRDEIR
jgi:hypothetical protein